MHLIRVSGDYLCNHLTQSAFIGHLRQVLAFNDFYGGISCLLDLVQELAAAGTTVVLSTHHLEEARACDQVVLLAGRVVASGIPTEVLAAENLREAFAGRVLETDRGVVIDDHGHGDQRHGDHSH